MKIQPTSCASLLPPGDAKESAQAASSKGVVSDLLSAMSACFGSLSWSGEASHSATGGGYRAGHRSEFPLTESTPRFYIGPPVPPM
jgi:hypothetical protein